MGCCWEWDGEEGGRETKGHTKYNMVFSNKSKMALRRHNTPKKNESAKNATDTFWLFISALSEFRKKIIIIIIC